MKRTVIVAALAALSLSPALAQQTAPAEPKAWLDALKLTAYIEAGINFATENPRDEIAFGHSFTDRSGRPVVNQAGFVLERPIDATAEALDLGFKVHGFYGTDARYTHFLGLFDRGPKSLYQFDVVDANGQAHVPWGFAPVSTDFKLGAYATPLGLEVIDPRGNFFYSKSYIFSYGLPLKHLGLLTTTHATSYLDIYAGIDTGTNTGIGRPGDNNGAAAFIAGVGLNLFEGKLTVLALTHTGPETPRTFEGLADTDSEARSFNDILVTWKITDALTSITEFNYVKDDAAPAQAYGVAQYFTYALTDKLTVGIRGEMFRDDDGFFVFRAPGRRDVANILGGRTVEDSRSGSTGGPNTYGAITLGLNWKPAIGYEPMEGLVIRPEIRYDRAFLDDLEVRPFDGGTKRSQVTLGIDVVIPFSIF